MDIKDCRIDIWDGGRIRTGMQPVTTDNGVKVTHLPTGLIAHVDGNPSQHKNRNVALAMLDAGVTEITKQARAGSGGLRIMDIIEELADLKGDFESPSEQDIIRSLIGEARKYVPKEKRHESSTDVQDA